MPAGVRVLETALIREYGPSEIAVCFPNDIDKFIGRDTRTVVVSTHKPLGVTFAADGDMPETSATPPVGLAMLNVIGEAAPGVA